jgi:chaperonin cofactor prefoldin
MSNDTVPLATADFLLGRLIATAKINDQLNKNIAELQERVATQRKYFEAQSESMKELQDKLTAALQQQKITKKRSRPLVSLNKARVKK